MLARALSLHFLRASAANLARAWRQRIYRMVLESQLLHKIVKLFGTVANRNNKLTFLWEN